jgi:hypothetical protein
MHSQAHLRSDGLFPSLLHFLLAQGWLVGLMDTVRALRVVTIQALSQVFTKDSSKKLTKTTKSRGLCLMRVVAPNQKDMS